MFVAGQSMDGYEWVDQCPQGGTVKCCYTIVSAVTIF